jgi:hypothetical protein
MDKQNFLVNTKIVEEYSYARNQPKNKKFIILNNIENYSEKPTIPSYKNCPPIKKESGFWVGVL